MRWDRRRGCLIAPCPRERSYVDWLGNVYAAIRSEYGDRLVVCPATAWINVPGELREAMAGSMQTMDERLAMAAARAASKGNEREALAYYQRISLPASAALRAGDWSRVVALLSASDSPLSAADQMKLRYARTKLEP